MGGNALNGKCVTRRFERAEYLEIETDVVNKLRKIAPNSLVQPVTAYKNKPSFGDLDVLFWNAEPLHWPRYFTQLFDTKGYTKNGNVYSFEYKQMQVDLILCPCDSKNEFNTSQFYFAYNDLGNFMGRIAHKMGFKYGHRGLTFVLKDGDYQFDELVVSQRPDLIMRFLGYDFARFLDGFDELEDVFEYAASTEFFNKDIFLLHNRNHKSRVRDVKRKSYNAFLDWMETRTDLNAYPWESMEERGGRKETAQFMLRAYEFFPEFKKTCEDALWRFERHLQAKKLFNGDLVREWTELDGPDLGKVMKEFREYVDGQKMNVTDFVLENGQEFCKNVVLNIKYVLLA